jgi:hypothetical protein
MKPLKLIVFLSVVCACAIRPALLHAQDSRTDVIATQQAAKAKALTPYTPGTVEKVVDELRRRFIEEPNGVYPYFGSVYGGGFMLGAGYRRLYGDASQWYVKGLYSIRQYKLLEVGTATRDHIGGRLAMTARAGFRDATQLPFFGLGMDTVLEGRANTRLIQSYGEVNAQLNPVRVIRLTGSAGIEDFQQRDPLGTFPSVATSFSPATAPGLAAEPRYLHTSGSAGIDWRTSPGYSRRGGYYGIALHNYADSDDTYTFNRMDVDLIQHLPILRETWVLSVRGRMQSTLHDDDLVPFFLLPSLGSGDTLRAFHSWRFRDRHSLLTSAEWRWIPNKNGFDMALFYDAGKVAARRSDLDLDALKSNVGIGARFHGPSVTALRIELARGSEGWNTVFTADAAF